TFFPIVRHRGFDVGDLRHATKRLDPALDLLVLDEVGFQLRGELAMPRHPFCAVGPLAGVHRPEIIRQDLIEGLLASGNIAVFAGHGSPKEKSPRTPRRLISPRRRSPATDASLRSMCRPISATVCPLR